MLKFFFKKQRQVESLIYSYLDNLRMTQKFFAEALNTCVKDGVCGDFDFLTARTHKFESKADDIREEIKELMYGKALIPESRGDVMGLLEAIDEVPRIFEQILYIIQTQKLLIPELIVSDLNELLLSSLEGCDLMIKQVEALFKKNASVRDLVLEIDHIESQCDHIKRRIITKIFDSNIEPFEKLQLKEVVFAVGSISDKSDHVARLVNIINMKRLV
jgi:predicted phosphate transport protein (TIGR00153 family)